jgi:hypothetical protein
MTPLPHRVHRPAAALLALACHVASAQVVPVGPPTYDTTMTLDLAPGDRPPITAVLLIPGWASSGSTGTAGRIVGAPFIDFRPSEAQAISNNVELGALSYVAGLVQYDPLVVPHLRATATASNLRYWQTGAVDTPLDFTPFLDGFVRGEMTFAEVPFLIYARVGFALDVVDLAGQPLLQVFRHTASLDWNVSSSRWQFSTTSTLPGTDWADSFTTAGLPPPFPTLTSSLVYADFLDDAYIAQAGSLFGLRWTLETEVRLEGIAVQAALTSDFLNTAGLGFAISADAPPGASLTEVLVLPPAVPEPTAAWLLAAGLAMLACRRQLHHARP